MKLFSTALIAFGLALPGLSAQAQTLATPPAKETAPVAKKQDPKLGAKINDIIKKQPAATPPQGTKPTTPKPASTAAATTSSTQTPVTEEADKPAPPKPRPQSKVERLITEREQLVLKYDYLKTQNNNFWGKASKEDLIAVVDALKEVLQKDEQIIQAVEQANLETRRAVAKRAAELEAQTKQLNTQVQGDKRMISDNIYDLRTSLNNSQNLLRRKDREIRDLEEQVQTVKDAKFEHDAIAAFFAMLCLVLVGYIVRLRSQLGRSTAKQRAKA
jgi:hypothetical protein